MKKGQWLGIVGGFIFFIVVCYILFIYPDFDQKLIDQVETGTEYGKLISEIDQQRIIEVEKASKDLESHVMNVNYWKGPKSVSNDDFAYYKGIYNSRMNAISQLYDLRMKYVKNEIGKEEFQKKIEEIKPILEA